MTIKTWQERLQATLIPNKLQEELLSELAKIDELRARLDAWEKQEPVAFLAADQYGNIGLSCKENIALRSCEADSKSEALELALVMPDEPNNDDTLYESKVKEQS